MSAAAPGSQVDEPTRRVFLARAALLAAAPLGLSACRESDSTTRTLTVYSSADEAYARLMVSAFEQETGIAVTLVGDTEATKTTGLVQRLRNERDRPRAAVFWSSEVFLTVQLAREGILDVTAPSDAALATLRPASLTGEGSLWRGFATRARVAVFHRQRVPEADRPRSMHDLLDQRWKGRIVMARPQFGTTRGHMASLVWGWGEVEARRWLEAMRDNRVRLLDGNSAVVRAVAMGEADAGLTDTDDVWAGQRNGWQVDAAFVHHRLNGTNRAGTGGETHGDRPNGQASDRPGNERAKRESSDGELRVGFGVLVIPNTVALVKDGPNRGEAQRFVDFLLSANAERLLAGSDSRNIPTHPDVLAEFPELRVPDAAEVDYSAIANAMANAMELCEGILG